MMSNHKSLSNHGQIAFCERGLCAAENVVFLSFSSFWDGTKSFLEEV